MRRGKFIFAQVSHESLERRKERKLSKRLNCRTFGELRARIRLAEEKLSWNEFGMQLYGVPRHTGLRTAL